MHLTPVGIQKRIVTAIIGTALLIFAVFCLGLAFYRQSLMQSRVEEFLMRNASLVAAAVDTGDKTRTLQILQSYKSTPQIIRVDIIQPDGSTLATYPPGNSPLVPATWNRRDGTYLGANTADVVSSFPAGSARPSRVFIRMSLAVLKQRERQVLVELTTGVLLILCSSALLQFVLLKRWVLQPLGQLAAIAESAAGQGDYSRRMPAHDRDEFGQLGKSFNALLAAVEQREAALRQDISKRKETEAKLLEREESLRESRRLYEDLVASLPMGVYRVSARAEGDVLEYVSDSFCKITGLSRQEALENERRVYEIIHPEDRAAFEQANATAFEKCGHFQWEGRASVGGQTRWLHFESHPTKLPDRPPFWTGVVYDVTDRHEAEDAFHQQHSLLEGTLQSTADGILAVSSEGRITSYNRQFLELWHVPKNILDTDDTQGLAEYILKQLSNPAAMQSRVRNFGDTSKADTFDTLEFSDGRVYERFSRPQLVDGRVVGRVWSFRDVTARHWAVASLRDSEHKFKMLFETANDAILIMNEKAFLDCNQMSEIMYGSPREKIIGQSPVYFSPERQADGSLSAEKAAEKIRAALTGTPQFFEWIHARGDGSLFNAEISLNRLELRGQAVIQAIVRDITARKQAEAAQHDAEQLYRTLVNTSPDGITLLDMTGRLLYCSPKALELLYGSPQAELVPEKTALDFISEKDKLRAAEMLRSAGGEKAPVCIRLLMRRMDGHEFVAELNGRLLRDSLGIPWGILTITRDITERQRQEDELKSKNTELERFTYTVSHDLRSPLITIKGFAGALISDVAAGRTDRLQDDLKRIVLAADKMSDLLNALLELSRIGRIVNPPTKVSMTKLAQDVLELLAGSIAQSQATVTVYPDLPPAYGDAQRLQEVLQNLVENALKFPAPNRPPEIEIGFKPHGDDTAYFVRDHGRGIEPRFHQSIFGLFNKLDPRSQGAGIGLALVRRIVEFHGGSVWVESGGTDTGATFYFTLPVHKALSSGPAT